MALLRLIARSRLVAVGAMCVLAACNAASAQPAPGRAITPPAGWVAMPAIAEAARGTSRVVAEAWGDPARGCYAVSLHLPGAGATADAILGGMTGIPDALAITDVVKDIGTLELRFSRPGHAGRLRAVLGPTGVTALACFANEREPVACDAQCTQLLAGVR